MQPQFLSSIDEEFLVVIQGRNSGCFKQEEKKALLERYGGVH